jgi:hypothetical protein
MKDMSMMHYFLEVSQITNEIFLSEGKYRMGILKKFSMTEYKMDLKKMNDDDSDKIDPQLIGSLLYMVKKPDLIHAMQ